jgi:alkanesulfonate monooxygenase SsuD/methylene tetrahydromethanopterin reductase-like flavin-dependent oxidoreductase (luciferase family)
MDVWQTHPWVREGAGKIRFGVRVAARAAEVDWSTRRALAQAADALGFDSLWVPDHPVFLTDPWTALAAYATATRRVRLGPMVSCVAHRSTLMTARLAADVDRLSGGRLVLGLGAPRAGWFEPETRFMGLGRVPRPGVRLAALLQTVADVRRYWSGEPVRLAKGRLAGETLLWPPVQRPRIPILIGGTGDRVTVRRVAEHADMCNFEETRAQTAADVRRKLGVLRRCCRVIGRPDDSMIKSYSINGVVLARSPRRLDAKTAALGPLFAAEARRNMATPRDLVARLRPILAVGIGYVVANLTDYNDIETLELLARQVVPAVQALAA